MERTVSLKVKAEVMDLISGLFNTGELEPEKIEKVIEETGGLGQFLKNTNFVRKKSCLAVNRELNRIRSAVELGKRVLLENTSREEPLLNAPEVFQYLVPRIGWPDQEEFWVLALDVRQRPIALIMVAKGTIEEVSVTMAQIFKELIRLGAPRGICCHTHPSGDPAPSDSDIAITDSILEAGRLLGIAIVDHIILGQGDYVSLAQRGYM